LVGLPKKKERRTGSLREKSTYPLTGKGRGGGGRASNIRVSITSQSGDDSGERKPSSLCK